jgi:hypothetical protein
MVVEQNRVLQRQLDSSTSMGQKPFEDKESQYSNVPPFDRGNYLLWATLFKTKLSGRLREILTNPESLSISDQRNMNSCLFSALCFSLSAATPSAMGLIAGKLSTLEGDGLGLWNFLKSEEERLTWDKVLEANHQVGNFNIQNGEESSILRARVVNFGDRFRQIQNLLSEDQQNAIFFVQAISQQHPDIAEQIKGMSPDLTITLDQACDRFNSLISSGKSRAMVASASFSIGTSTRNGGARPICSYCKKTGHSINDCFRLKQLRSTSTSQQRSTSSQHDGPTTHGIVSSNSSRDNFVTNSKTNYCSGFNYNNISNKFGNNSVTSNLSTNGIGKSSPCVDSRTMDALSSREESFSNKAVEFIVDSGASRHMCIDCPISNAQCIRHRIQTADGSFLPANKSGNFGVLNSVLQAPLLSHNLMSVSSSVADGNTFVFDKHGVSIFKSDKVHISGDAISSGNIGSDGLYRLQIQSESSEVEPSTQQDLHAVSAPFSLPISSDFSSTVLVADVVDENEAFKWHCRFGHPATRLLRYLFLHRLVTSTSPLPRRFSRHDLTELSTCGCYGCIAGKQTMDDITRRPHRPPATSASSPPPVSVPKSNLKPGRLVCVDLLTSSVHGKFNFALTMIDVDSRYLWVYPLKTKNASEVLEKIKSWIRHLRLDHVEPQFFTTIRSDSGSEFTNKLLQSTLLQLGVKQQFSAPQHHVYLIERANRTLQSTTRAMLHHANLKQGYWIEALQCACYTLNRLPTRCNPFKTRYETFHGRKPDVSNLRIFGSICYRKKYDIHRKIWDTESTRCRFMGYGESDRSDRAWKLLNTKNSQMHYSDNVVFIETNLLASLDDTASLPVMAHGHDVEPAVLTLYQGPEPGGVVDPQPEVVAAMSRSLDPVIDPTETVLQINSLHHQQVHRALAVRVKSTIEGVTPTSLEQALSCDDKEHWMKSIQDEVDSLFSNGTLEVMKRPSHYVKALPIKYVFKIKTNKDGDVERYKTRCTAMGNLQDQHMDYEETFAPVVRQSSVRILLSVAAQNNFPVHQMDVDTAFLYGTLEEGDDPVYLKMPLNYPIPEELQQEDPNKLICRVRKGIYGLKQSPRLWNKNFNESMLRLGFKRFSSDMGLYSRCEGIKQLFVGLYVDDLVIVGSDIDAVVQFKKQIGEIYKMKDLGPINQLLGMDVRQDLEKGTVSLSQSKYIKSIIERFELSSCQSSPIPMDPALHLKPAENLATTFPYPQAIGSLLYLTSCTRPDISFAVNNLSRYLSCHDTSHATAAIQIMKYLKGTIDHGIVYSRQSNYELIGFSDSDHARCQITRRSVTGYVFTLGGSPISWRSKTQPTVALSSTEAEYMALAGTICEAEYLKRVLSEFNLSLPKLQIYSDNNGAIAIIKKGSTTDRTKHIDVQHHFVHERYVDGNFGLNEMRTHLMPADLFTKPLPKIPFLTHRDVLMKSVQA